MFSLDEGVKNLTTGIRNGETVIVLKKYRDYMEAKGCKH